MVLPHSPLCHLRAISVIKVIVLKHMSHHSTLQPRGTRLVSESSDKAQKLSSSFAPAIYFCLVLNHVWTLTPRPLPMTILLLQILSLTFLLSNLILAVNSWDFPSCPVVKSLPFNAGAAGLIPGWGAETPQDWKPISQNRSNIVTNSTNT